MTGPTIPSTHQLPHHHLLPSPAISHAHPRSTNHWQRRQTQMADDNNTKWRRVEKGRGREGATGVQDALFFFCSLSISDSSSQLLLAAQPPPISPSRPHQPNKNDKHDEEGFPPPRRISFHFDHVREGRM